jgi:hypothetical protein
MFEDDRNTAFADTLTTLTLHPSHCGRTHRRSEERIFPEALLASAPPRVARDVETGDERDVHAAIRKFRGHRALGTFDELRVESRPKAQVRRKDRPSERLMAVRRLLTEQDADMVVTPHADGLLDQIARL